MAEHQRLPGATTDAWEWRTHGLCRGLDSAIFFHPDHERDPARHHRDALAKSLCQRCPVLQQCRTHALTVREPYGVWGGLTAEDRHHLLHPTSTNRPTVGTRTRTRTHHSAPR